MWRFPYSKEEVLEQLLIRGRAFATFSTIEKALADRKKSFRGPYVVRVWIKLLGHVDHSLKLTTNFSNLWKDCYRLTNASFHRV